MTAPHPKPEPGQRVWVQTKGPGGRRRHEKGTVRDDGMVDLDRGVTFGYPTWWKPVEDETHCVNGEDIKLAVERLAKEGDIIIDTTGHDRGLEVAEYVEVFQKIAGIIGVR